MKEFYELKSKNGILTRLQLRLAKMWLQEERYGSPKLSETIDNALIDVISLRLTPKQ